MKDATVEILVTVDTGHGKLEMVASVAGTIPGVDYRNEKRIAKELRKIAAEIEHGCYLSGVNVKRP